MRASSGTAASARWAGCEIWGVLNVTPDSFSDGGLFLAVEAAVAHGRQMARDGAAVIDVGGQSTRPRGQTYGAGAAVIDVAEETRRVEPVIAALSAAGIRVSIDTSRGAVAERAIRAGARIVNDVTMGSDPALLAACAGNAEVELVLMHARGDGHIDAETTDYGADVVATVKAELAAAIERAVSAGVPREAIWIDPGIGFSKTASQSATLLARLPELLTGEGALPHRVLVGASRKSFLAALAENADGSSPPPSARLPASLVAATVARRHGAHAVRVHDVAETHQALVLDAELARHAATATTAMTGGGRA